MHTARQMHSEKADSYTRSIAQELAQASSKTSRFTPSAGKMQEILATAGHRRPSWLSEQHLDPLLCPVVERNPTGP